MEVTSAVEEDSEAVCRLQFCHGWNAMKTDESDAGAIGGPDIGVATKVTMQQPFPDEDEYDGG